jgi:CDP-diacylglycerol--serine O-phosphatidyltransferase
VEGGQYGIIGSGMLRTDKSDRPAMRYRDPRWLRKEPIRGRLRRRISVLPTLMTLGNLLCGFSAIWYASLPVVGTADKSGAFTIAGYLIFGAMIFDMLDGSMARLTRATSDFGAELDSLADVVSFGIVPAFLSLKIIARLLAVRGGELINPLAQNVDGRFFWMIAAIYVACTALRLARFNAHNAHSMESHLIFRGLPSPAAAGVAGATVIFFEALRPNASHFLPFHVPEFVQSGVGTAFPYLMPVILLALSALMVSRIEYPHLINQYLRGRRPFSYVVRLVLLVLLFFWQPQLTALLGIYWYAFFPPIKALFQRILSRGKPEAPAPPPISSGA